MRTAATARPVHLNPAESRSWDALSRLARQIRLAATASDRIAAAAVLARSLDLPRPGTGHTTGLWDALATAGATDLTVARVIEPHLDALAILDEAGDQAAPQGLLGIYAAEGPGHRLTARPSGADDGDWVLDGTKPWCSLADHVDGFLVTAWVDDEQRRLFLVDRSTVSGDSFTLIDSPWHARGLRDIHSPTTAYRDVPARVVGEPGWYLQRPGFAWGAMGVAAIWFGATVAIGRRVRAHCDSRPPDQVALMHLGRVASTLHRARCALADAAAQVDSGAADGPAGARLALMVRQVVRASAEEVLLEAGHAMGPGPLTGEAEHAERVADLQVYLRQEHGARDAAALGRMVLDDPEILA